MEQWYHVFCTVAALILLNSGGSPSYRSNDIYFPLPHMLTVVNETGLTHGAPALTQTLLLARSSCIYRVLPALIVCLCLSLSPLSCTVRWLLLRRCNDDKSSAFFLGKDKVSASTRWDDYSCDSGSVFCVDGAAATNSKNRCKHLQ